MSNKNTPEQNAASQSATADLIRSKLAHLYTDEPAAAEEIAEVSVGGPHSKHQQFIAKLQQSGKSVVQVQTEWHLYYANLSDEEKREVWAEFNQHIGDLHPTHENAGPADEPRHPHVAESRRETEIHNYFLYKAKHRPGGAHQPREYTEGDLPELNRHVGSTKKQQATRIIKHRILKTVSSNGRLKTSHHIKSAVFSVGFAMLATGLLFFVTNNERFIAPFITPSRNASAAPLINDGQTISQDAKIIIPKINLEAPLSLGATSNEEDAIQAELEAGIVLYPNTGLPGENESNPVFFGHSSNNLFNKGAYKFVFVRLHQLEVGDTYAINFRGTQYVYKIFARDVVRPNQIEVLTEKPKPAMTTLITCDPPGTSDYRLVIRGEQISPSLTANSASTALSGTATVKEIPSNAPSLFQRLFGGR